MARKTVTLYVDDTSLRLLVVRGRRIKKWADSPLEPGLVKNNIVIDEAEVAARVKQLFKTQKVGTKKIIVGLSGMNCLTRPVTLPAIPASMLDEAVIREARRVLPVPPEQLHIFWQPLPSPEGKSQLFMVAIPCKMADPLLRMLRQAGLKPYLMDIKPLVLARVARATTAIIVDVQPTEFDIVITAYGIPQPIRTVPLSIDEVPQQDRWQKVKEELARTITFYNSNNPERPLGADVPVFVSGELANQTRFHKSLSEEFGLPVTVLSYPKCPEHLDATRYMVNIGLALKEPSSGKEAGPAMVNVNALPVPYRPKPLPLLKILALPGAAVSIGLIVLLTTFIRDATASAAAMRSELDLTNKLITQRQQTRQAFTRSIAELEKTLAGTLASRDTFTTMLNNIDSSQERINEDLKIITGNLPDKTTLSAINHTLDKMTLQGRAQNEMEVLDYARKLEASGRFPEITVATIKPVDSAGADFVLVLKTKGKT